MCLAAAVRNRLQHLLKPGDYPPTFSPEPITAAPLPADWLPFEPFVEPRLPEFPVERLPPILRAWAEAQAIASQTGPEIAALFALAAGSAAASRCSIEGRRGWIEPLNLAAAIVSEAGSRAADVLRAATQPLRDWEAAQREEARRGPSEDETFAEMDSALRGDPRPDRRAILPDDFRPWRFQDEVTPSSMSAALIEHGAVAGFSSQGGIFRQLAGRMSQSLRTQIQLFHAAQGGDSLMLEPRHGRFVRRERPGLALAAIVEPTHVQGLAGKADFAGGPVISRFLYARPEHRWGRRVIAPPPVSPIARGDYQAALYQLVNLHEDVTLRLAPAAERLLGAWETELEPQLASDGPLGECRAWGSYLAGATLRIAGVLHLFEHAPGDEVAADSMETAIAIGRYLIPQAIITFAEMGATPPRAEVDARYLLRWLRRHGPRTFSLRDAYQETRRRFLRPGDLEESVDQLIGRGYLRLVAPPISSGGRPSSPRYEVNPAMFGKAEKLRRPGKTPAQLRALRRQTGDGMSHVGRRFDPLKSSPRIIGASRTQKSDLGATGSLPCSESLGATGPAGARAIERVS